MSTLSATEFAVIFGQPGKVPRVTVLTPWGIATQVHAELDEVFLAACTTAEQTCAWRPQRIDSYNPRPIRGYDGDRLSEWSKHAWAAAWDFFATPPDTPPPGGVWTPEDPVPKDFARCFTDLGFRWGAAFSRVDLPHIEWAAGLPDRTAPAATPPTVEELAMPTYSTATCSHPLVGNRVDLVAHDADDGAIWHAWGTGDDADAGGWERLDPRMQILPGTLSATWTDDGQRFVLTGVGADGAIWNLTWVEQHGDSPGRWSDPARTDGRVA